VNFLLLKHRLFFEVKAVGAVEIAVRSSRLGHQMKGSF